MPEREVMSSSSPVCDGVFHYVPGFGKSIHCFLRCAVFLGLFILEHDFMERHVVLDTIRLPPFRMNQIERPLLMSLKYKVSGLKHPIQTIA